LKFPAKLVPSGNATGVEVPVKVMTALGPEARPPVAITINGHTWRGRVASMRGQRLIGISGANRAAAGIAEGEIIEVDLQLDREPRDVLLPLDMADALRNAPEAKAAFDRLPFGLKRKHVAEIEEAKSADVRQRRIGKLVAALRAAHSA
jgi:Domain of unknown function (DUF1905)/Bacteriocin-protection, YdeI or OmpD-Associated